MEGREMDCAGDTLEDWLEEAWGELQLEDIPVMELAKAAFAMFVLLCLDVLAMFASVCTLVRNLGASE